VSQGRIFVAHAIGGMKRYTIVGHGFRNRKEHFADDVIAVCAGLRNDSKSTSTRDAACASRISKNAGVTGHCFPYCTSGTPDAISYFTMALILFSICR
jgi:hypothetical protein